jgi:competence protein ComEC
MRVMMKSRWIGALAAAGALLARVRTVIAAGAVLAGLGTVVSAGAAAGGAGDNAPSDAAQSGGTLKIYFIDVEGGQSTLLVTPSGQSLLVDTGWAGDGSPDAKPGDPAKSRDARRIVAAARNAGIQQIDYLLLTHFHPDHDGGMVELSQLLPIRHFIDHGTLAPGAMADAQYKAAYEAFMAVRNKAPHSEPKPGDRLPLKDVDAVVVSSAGSTITAAVAGAGSVNSACGSSAMPARDPFENPRSTGFVLTFGKFRFLDVGDLSGQPLFDLACPKSLVGAVDVYLVAHHGGPDVSDPATFAAFRPRVAIMNNGLKKGGAPETYETLHHVSGLEDVWQLHRSEASGDKNFAPARIANLDESTANWIKLSAKADGTFKVTNGRTGESKDYAPSTR